MSKNRQDYFKSFINDTLEELKIKGICYVYKKEHIKELERILGKKLVVKEINFGVEKGYSVTLK